MIFELKKEIHQGLTQKQKTISSKFLYDEKGSEIFNKITTLPEYYLTNSEFEILNLQSQKIFETLFDQNERLHVVELGPGDGSKIQTLLKSLSKHDRKKLTYSPLDISKKYLKNICEIFPKVFPEIKVNAIQSDYFQNLTAIKNLSESPKFVLFLGSNIGNFSNEKAVTFLKKVKTCLNQNDYFFIGMDLKKNPFTIKEAYDDPYSITKQFNLNLLHRINRELDGNFVVSNFDYYTTYCPNSGEVKSYLVSLNNQKVQIGALEKTYTFRSGETIQTEISKKYDKEEIAMLADEAGFTVVKNFFDCKEYFVDTLWQVKG